MSGTGKWPTRGRVLIAAVTPLASILSSGLLIIVRVLERTLGALSVFGAIGVCAVGWVVGTSIRHCVRVVEPLAKDGTLDLVTRRVDWSTGRLVGGRGDRGRLRDLGRALSAEHAQYVVAYATGGDGQLVDRIIACTTVVLIIGIGVLRGFTGLDWLDRVSLVGVLLVLGGIVITVQGFETARYLEEEFDVETGVWASRVAQLVAASIYVGFVAVATPVMGLGTSAGADSTLLDITGRVAPLLALPLVLSAVLSQFSAAVADTAAADGNLRTLSGWMHGPRPYLASGIAAIILAATVPTYTNIAVASRAFAAYYALQAVLALRHLPWTHPQARLRRAGHPEGGHHSAGPTSELSDRRIPIRGALVSQRTVSPLSAVAAAQL